MVHSPTERVSDTFLGRPMNCLWPQLATTIKVSNLNSRR